MDRVERVLNINIIIIICFIKYMDRVERVLNINIIIYCDERNARA